MDKLIMTPIHPRWNEFIDRLNGPEGCDVKEDENGKFTWHCKGGEDKSKATVILSDIDGIDIHGSLDFFEDHGGFCDCEILMNVENSYQGENEKGE